MRKCFVTFFTETQISYDMMDKFSKRKGLSAVPSPDQPWLTKSLSLVMEMELLEVKLLSEDESKVRVLNLLRVLMAGLISRDRRWEGMISEIHRRLIQNLFNRTPIYEEWRQLIKLIVSFFTKLIFQIERAGLSLRRFTLEARKRCFW